MEEMRETIMPAPDPVSEQGVSEQSKIEDGKRLKRFEILAIPTVIYAVFFTFCMYDNPAGILQIFLAFSTIVYCRMMEAKFEITPKKDTILLELMMVLLGISTGTTGNGMIIIFNLLGMFLLTVVRLLHNAHDDEKWDLGKYAASICVTTIYALEHVVSPIVDATVFFKAEKNERTKTISAVVIGLLLAIPLLTVAISLLLSADVVFEEVWHRIFRLDMTEWFLITCTFLFGLFASYGGIAAVSEHRVKDAVAEKKKLSAIIAITTLSLTMVVYFVFSVIQIVYLFIGKMALPQGYTYAEYAREGFFQLLTVCILNVIIVLAVQKHFYKHPVLNGLLAAISACTYVMGASAFLRMLMYIDVYYLTRKRILVLWALITIGFLLAGIVIQIFREQFPLLRYGMCVFCACYLVLAFSHMDYFIADYNIIQMQNEGTLYSEDNYDDLDVGYGVAKMNYLNTLSSDAAGAFAGIEPSYYEDYKSAVINSYKKESLRQWNLSHYLAWKRFQ